MTDLLMSVAAIRRCGTDFFRRFPGVSKPGLTTLKGITLSTRVDDAITVRDLAARTQQALDELQVVVSRRLNELSVYVDQTGAQKRNVG